MALPFFARLKRGFQKILDDLRFWSKHTAYPSESAWIHADSSGGNLLYYPHPDRGHGGDTQFLANCRYLEPDLLHHPFAHLDQWLGLQEVTITNLYTFLGGLSPATSIALALILRLVWLVGSLPGAFFVGDVLAGKSPTDLEEPLPEEAL